MARSISWPWGLLILILSLPREHGVGALTFAFDGLNTIYAWSSSNDGHSTPVSLPPPPLNLAPLPPVSAAPPSCGISSNSHASSASRKIAVEIIGGLLSGVIFVSALYKLAAEVAPPLGFFLCHTGGTNQEGKNFPERLYDEMTQSWKLKYLIRVFFDRRVLSDGLPFPDEILMELERTQVGVVLVTPDFFTRKWPMVELVYFVESSKQISNMRRVLPLFYRMTVDQVKDHLEKKVWEGYWAKMSEDGNHSLSVERCRHAVHELCKYKGVEYSGSNHDRGRDKEYIREILKRVGKIVCEERWKNNRAKDLVNSLLRGHAPKRSREVLLHKLEPLILQPLPIVASPPSVATPSSSLRNDGHLAPDIYLSLQTPQMEPKPPSLKPPVTVASPPPILALSPNFTDDDHLTPNNLPASHALFLGPEPLSPQPPPLAAAPLPHVVAPSPSFNNDIYLASIIFLTSQAPLSGLEPSNPQPPPLAAPPPPIIAPSPSFNNDNHLISDIYLAPDDSPPLGPEPPSLQPLPSPDVGPSPSFSSPSSSFNSPPRLARRFPRRLRIFISHGGGNNLEGKHFSKRLHHEMTKSWKLKFFTRVFLDKRKLKNGHFFPLQIIEELEKTDFGIVLVTEDFFTQKWPMLELVTFVESLERPNSKMLRLLPLYYKMTPHQVTDNLRRGVWEGYWKEMFTHSNHPLSVEQCRHAVTTLCRFKGVEYNARDRGYDTEYIREIVKSVEMCTIQEMWKMLIKLLSW